MLSITCPECGFENLPGMKFCGQCGVNLGRLCPECGFINPASYQYCGQCGIQLSEESIPPESKHPATHISEKPSSDGSLILSEHSSLEGERRLASIIMADVTSSTDLLEQIGTEAWVEIMNRLLQILEAQVYRFGGEVDQFRGDGLVAFFGATTAHEDDPERAVLAALSMQDALKPFADELSQVKGIQLQLRVGVNTGEVIVAIIGDSSQHSEDTAMGEAIALAARIEAAAKPGTVLVSEKTYRMVSSSFDWKPMGEIIVKGVSKPVTVYRPLTPRPDVRKSHQLQASGLISPIVGRDAEFETLIRCIEELHSGRGGIVMITGDVGFGKSRLVAEIRQQITRDQALIGEVRNDDDGKTFSLASLNWLQGRCRSYGQSYPFSIWLDLLWNWLGIPEGGVPEEIRERLRHLTEELWGKDMADYYPYLATFLSLTVEDIYSEKIEHLDAEGLRHKFYITIYSWLGALAARSALVLNMMDLHWADSSSLDLLEYCLPLCDQVSLMWLLVYRPDHKSLVWDLHHHIETQFPHRAIILPLAPLSNTQTNELIDHLVGPDSLPMKARQLLLNRTEGNPYYLEEFLHALVEQEILVKDAQTGKWSTTRPVDVLQMPDTLQNLLLARIDRLSPEIRPVLQMAAVIGTVFWSDVLAALAGDGDGLHSCLTEIQRSQLIVELRQRPELGMEYAFKSSLIRDAAYESVLKTQRAVFHRQAADFIEETVNEKSLAQYHDILSFHYNKSGAYRKELFHTLLSAEQAQRIYANTEAIDNFSRAIELLDQIEEKQAAPLGESENAWRLEALRGLGKTHFGIGKIENAENYFQEAISLGKRMNLNPQVLVRLFYWLGEVFYWQGRYDELLQIGEQGFLILGDDTQSVEAALMNQTVAMGHYFARKDFEVFRKFTYQTAQFINSLPYSEELRPAFDHIVIANIEDKNVAEATRLLQVLEQNAEISNDLTAKGEVHEYSGALYFMLGDMKSSILRRQQALEIFTKIGDVKHEGRCLQGLGTTWLSLGDIQKAEENISKSLAIAEAIGNQADIAGINGFYGRVLMCKGSWEKAIEAFKTVGQILRENKYWEEEWSSWFIGQVYLSRGMQIEAIQHMKTIETIGSSTIMQNPYDFAYFLSGLERSYKNPENFRAFCLQFKRDYPVTHDSPLDNWYLVESEVGDEGKLLIDNHFTDSLGSEWVWSDPYSDCTFNVRDGLEIHAANGRNLRHINLSAPRILRPFSGSFIVQTICRQLTEANPAIGGLLIWKDEQNWLRLDWGELGRNEITFVVCRENKDHIVGRGCIPSDKVHLRLEFLGARVKALCSTDGSVWYTAGIVDFPVDSTVEIGLHALGDIERMFYPGSYPEGTAILFESFQLWEV